MFANKKLRATTTNSKEYKMASGHYQFEWTQLLSRQPFKNWKLYRKTQYKPKVTHKRTIKNGEHWRYKRNRSWLTEAEIVHDIWLRKQKTS